MKKKALNLSKRLLLQKESITSLSAENTKGGIEALSPPTRNPFSCNPALCFESEKPTCRGNTCICPTPGI